MITHIIIIIIIIIYLSCSWPPVDPFRSHVSRSPFKGQPWFLLPVTQYCFITLDILFTCCIQFLLHSNNLSKIESFIEAKIFDGADTAINHCSFCNHVPVHDIDSRTLLMLDAALLLADLFRLGHAAVTILPVASGITFWATQWGTAKHSTGLRLCCSS
jgi:hypothetical protein